MKPKAEAFAVLTALTALLQPGALAGQADPVPAISLQVETVESRARPYNAEPERVYQIDSIDVYSLSKYARLLYMSHSVTPQMVTALPDAREAATKWAEQISAASAATGLPVALIQAVIEVESGAIARAVSVKGARGLMQLMPDTQKFYGVSDPFDPGQNISAGSTYLADLYRRLGSLELALAAYNAGIGNVNKYGGIPPFKETRNYVSRVMDRYHALCGR